MNRAFDDREYDAPKANAPSFEGYGLSEYVESGSHVPKPPLPFIPITNEISIEERRLAREILQHSQSVVLISLRFLDAAYGSLLLVEHQRESFATNGQLLYYHPSHVLSLFSEDSHKVARSLLHSVLHCVFHHLFVSASTDPLYWDLACDIAVETMIESIELPAVKTAGSSNREEFFELLDDKLVVPTAQSIYRYLKDSSFTEFELEAIRRHFFTDDHAGWYVMQQPIQGMPNKDDKRGPEGASEDSDHQEEHVPPSVDEDAERLEEEEREKEQTNDSGDKPDCDNCADAPDSQPSETREAEDDAPASNEQNDAGTLSEEQGGSDQKRNQEGNSELSNPNFPQEIYDIYENKELWERIAEQMEVDLETLSKSQGDTTAGLLQALKVFNREKYDYSAFLRQFAVMGETLRINSEEFDYVYYTYGLSLYGKMPLIEPLEYKETRMVREFVIALDTSGSTSGKLVEAFVRKTYTMLKQTENFFRRINVHIIQSDLQIQEAVKIESDQQFDEYIASMTLRGMGGTDFRPVFTYVNDLIAQGEFKNLGGLIYFTDGLGTFPEKKPPYKTAFVFVDDGTSDPDVPIWAIKLLLDSEDL